MTASIWTPGVVIPDVDEDVLNVSQFFTATSAQTVFTFTDLVYTPGAGTLKVYRNGTQQTLGTDYSETSSSSITFTSGVTEGDRIAGILLVAYSAEDTSPAAYAADAKAAADAAASYAAIVTGMASIEGVQKQQYNFAISTDPTKNELHLAFSPTLPTPLTKGTRFCAINSMSTSDGAVSVWLDAIGPLMVQKRTITGSLAQLEPGDLIQNVPYDFIYNKSGMFTFVELVGRVSPAELPVSPGLHEFQQQFLGVI